MNITKLFDEINNYELNEDIKEENDDLKCNSCGLKSLVSFDGGVFCSKCGVLQEVRYSNEQEYRYYGENDSKNSDPSRVGMPINNLLPKSSMGTSIASNVGRNVYIINRIMQYHQWSKMPYEERSLWKDYEIISAKCIKLSLPQMIIEESKKKL